MNVLQLMMYSGTFVFAATGALKARTHHMDVFGGTVLAFVTAYGGGTIRDLLIGARPVNWINDNLALSLVIAAVLIVAVLTSRHRFQKTIFYTDAIGLGLFTAAGIERSLAYNTNEVYAVVLGVITATFGGFTADIICAKKPDLLKRGELYATACAIGGLVYIVLREINVDHNINMFACVLVVVATRIISKRKRIRLPEI